MCRRIIPSVLGMSTRCVNTYGRIGGNQPSIWKLISDVAHELDSSFFRGKWGGPGSSLLPDFVRAPRVCSYPEPPPFQSYIVTDRTPYYEALRKADETFRDGVVDVSEMEALMDGLLQRNWSAFTRWQQGDRQNCRSENTATSTPRFGRMPSGTAGPPRALRPRCSSRQLRTGKARINRRACFWSDLPATQRRPRQTSPPSFRTALG